MMLKTIVFGLALSATSVLFANKDSASITPPSTCPTVAALKKLGLNEAIYIEDEGMWAAYRAKNDLETQDSWTLLAYPLKAKNTNDALAQGNKLISKAILYSATPIEIAEDLQWACLYTSLEDKAQLIALNPSIFDFNPLLNHLKKLVF